MRQTDDFIWVQSGKDWVQTIQGYQPISGVPASVVPVPQEKAQASADVPAVPDAANK